MSFLGARASRPHLLRAAGVLALLSAVAALAQPAGEAPVVQVQIIGSTSVWTAPGSVFETDHDAWFQTERYGAEFTYRFTGVPNGVWTVKLGFVENKLDRVGQRVFSVLANGQAILDHFDIFRECGRLHEAVYRRANAVVRDGTLELAFQGHQDNAKVNHIRVYNDKYVFETAPADEQGSVAYAPKADAEQPYMIDMYETALSRLGSRLCFNPRPKHRFWQQSPLGHADYNTPYFERNQSFYDLQPVEHVFALACGARRYSLPFDERLPTFPHIAQRQTMTSLTYECGAPDLPLTAELRFSAPFYPEDVKLSTAPFIYLDVTLKNRSARAAPATFLLGSGSRGGETTGSFGSERSLGLMTRGPVFGVPTVEAWAAARGAPGVSVPVAGLPLPAPPSAVSGPGTPDGEGRTILPLRRWQGIAGLSWEVTVPPYGEASQRFLYVAYVDDPVLQVRGQPCRFKYTQFFRSPAEVADYALADRDTILRRTALFESTIYDATLPPELQDLIAFAFQSWVMNTWWVVDQQKHDWFSVWEGCCKFHSTVDVEYNVSPLYFQYWPWLMGTTLAEWVPFIKPSGVLAHDMGMGLTVGAMEYGHDMPVEENTNFVLLAHQYWKMTGDREALRQLLGPCQTLMDYVTRTDTNGDGFSETGCENTIDQGSAAVQYAPAQTYLAVKALGAYRCLREMAETLGQAEVARGCGERERLIAATLRTKGWLGDHYAVDLKPEERLASAAPDLPDDPATNPPATLGPSEPRAYEGGMAYGPGARGYERDPARPYPHASQPAPARPVTGWDGFSIYSANGLVYPLRAGLDVGFEREQMRQDLLTVQGRTEKLFGSPHTGNEQNMWISQNIFRDIAAAYLGLDFTPNVRRYWALQKQINQRKRGCFTDVYIYGSDSISLDYYPRGIAAIGLVPALGGITIDVPGKKITAAPLRVPLRLPLTTLADWEREQIPWLCLEAKDGQVTGRIEPAGCLRDYTLQVGPAAPAPGTAKAN